MKQHLSHKLFALITVIYFSRALPTNKDEQTDDVNYGILVDAGSTGSKLKIYKWSMSKSPASSLPTIQLLNNHKFKPALSELLDDRDRLGDNIDTMLKWAASNIPTTKHRTTPILILATAGMRFLDEEMTSMMMNNVRDILANTSRNPFAPLDTNNVEVLSGEEEAAYAWIAANYLLGFFQDNKPNNESVGVMEMGGGSTQIAFIPDVPIYDGEFHVTLAKKRYSLYVHSYLNFGANGINRQIIHFLQTRNSNYDPCMLEGDNKTVSLGQGKVMELLGSGDAISCQNILVEILKPSEGITCQPKPCVIRDIYQPTLTNATFYATQAFTYVPNEQGAVKSNGYLDMKTLKKAMGQYCSLTIEEAFKQRKKNNYASANCMQGNYMLELFTRYGFKDNSDQIKISSKVNSQRIDWALGAMLVKLSERFAAEKGSYSVVCPYKVKREGPNSTDYGVKATTPSIILSTAMLVLASSVANNRSLY